MTAVFIYLDELKKSRQIRVKTRLGKKRNSASVSHSPTNKYTSGDNIIDRNCNLIPHFKEYE